jgi:hypothetical protein
MSSKLFVVTPSNRDEYHSHVWDLIAAGEDRREQMPMHCCEAIGDGSSVVFSTSSSIIVLNSQTLERSRQEELTKAANGIKTTVSLAIS